MQLRFSLVPAVTAALAGVLVGCAPAQDPAPSGTSTDATVETSRSAESTGSTSVAGSPAEAGAGGFTEAQTADLCARLEGQLSNWRTYTPSVGRGGLNILVGEWGAANGVDLVVLAGDRGRIDAATSAQCPEVREEALRGLDIPDFASGLVGF
ncbi:hypothetical protein [Rhodococcus sp. B50]|uniref:hypothetical protein n=1 Tax=Rhodococcus sp. B50 TaxID=2682847 RepID=UPI001FD2B225|nr:hypothetical protein [Rhodococcus sp. B50]